MKGTERRRGGFPPNPHSVPSRYLMEVTAAENPGRVALIDGPKPSEDEVPWRSRLWVNGRNSADGNDYHPGDPIPEIEAIRQGVYVPVIGDEATPDDSRAVCSRCGGSGQYAPKKPKGHKPGCACKFCGPCRTCGGNGWIEEDDHGSQEDGSVEVEGDVQQDRGDLSDEARGEDTDAGQGAVQHDGEASGDGE